MQKKLKQQISKAFHDSFSEILTTNDLLKQSEDCQSLGLFYESEFDSLTNTEDFK
jgi:hypothetical protein